MDRYYNYSFYFVIGSYNDQKFGVQINLHFNILILISFRDVNTPGSSGGMKLSFLSLIFCHNNT